MATIQLKRALLGTPVAAPPGLLDGEPVFAMGGFTGLPFTTSGNDLLIHQGGTNHVLVSAARQVEVTGNQTIGGRKTFSLASISISGGNSGEALHTDGSGNLVWSPSGTGGAMIVVTHDASMAGDGTSTAPLTLVPATDPQIAAGIDNIHAISSVGLRSQLGLDRTSLQTSAQTIVPAINEVFSLGSTALQTVIHDISLLGTGHAAPNDLRLNPATNIMIDGPIAGIDNLRAITPAGLRHIINGQLLDLQTSNKTGVIPAINELEQLLRAMSGIMTLIGTYDVPNNNVVPVAGGPFPGGALPQAVPTNIGWYTIVEFGGTGTGHAPADLIDVADWLISNGTTWLHFSMHMSFVAARNVVVAVGTGIPGAANVQDALTYLMSDKLETVATDGISIIGNGLPGAGNMLEVGVVNGGTF